ncbi:hypothetical protein D3C72_1784990 [compost metagenome]
MPSPPLVLTLASRNSKGFSIRPMPPAMAPALCLSRMTTGAAEGAQEAASFGLKASAKVVLSSSTAPSAVRLALAVGVAAMRSVPLFV